MSRRWGFEWIRTLTGPFGSLFGGRGGAAGERHGVEQTPVLMEELVGWFGVGGIALEWSERLRPWLDRWLADGIVADPAVDDAGMDVWGGDGRLSAGHLAVLRRLAAAGLRITLIDGATVPGPPRTWGDRGGDAAAVVERP